MASGDTRTNQYLDIAANGTRSDLPAETCCETRTQTLIRGVAERIMDVEDEVEEIKNNPDVVDIVATYADLQAYDTQHLTDKDVIHVLQDETHDGDSTYYRYNKQTDTWAYIGESKQYTDFVGTDGTAAGVAGLVPAPATTDAGKFLKADGTWATAGGGGGSYTAGDGIDITNNVISVDTTTIQPKLTAGTNVQISSENVVSATDTTYSAGSGLDLTGTAFSVDTTTIQPKLTAGSNVTIDANNEISATDTTYSNFVGTDGTAAGTAGLVPAPATTDAGKFLKADGTWDTAGGGGPTVVQTTGTSTTDVMSQNAVTSIVEAQKLKLGGGAVASGNRTTALGYYANATPNDSIAIGANAYVAPGAVGAIALGEGAIASTGGELNIGTFHSNGYNSSAYRLISGVYDPQSAHDAATKGYVDTAVAGAAYDPTISNNTLYL